MTREIKFRAWEKPGVLLHQSEGTKMFDGKMWYDITEYLNKWHGHKDYEVMQFTGLRDSKGVEVYEGDVLAHHMDKRHGVIEWGTVGFIVNEGKNWTEKLDSWCYPLDSDGNIRGKIIGNIYENPELLN